MAAATDWTSATKALAAMEALLDTGALPLPQYFKACDIAKDARRAMWDAAPPTLSDLAWKLEQAIIFVDAEDEPDHPLNMVLRDLRRLAQGN